MSKKSNLSLFLFLVIQMSIFAQVIPKNNELLKIRTEIQNLVKDSIIPSMAVAVIKDGKILWQEALGYSNINQKKLANINSVYPLGSVSKSITATGIMQMTNSNQLNLQQNINSIISPIQLKDINGKVPKIKLWQLLSMSAGINHGYGVYGEEKDLPLKKDEQTKFFEETTIVAFKPGTVFEYSNRSMYLSELIIERSSKLSFQDYMNKHVFHPLGMTNTYAYGYQNIDNQKFVTKYSSKGLQELESNISYPSGGSGIWSSISDMTNFALFHLGVAKNDAVINDDNLRLMHEFRQGPADLFGLGWWNNNNVSFSNGNVGGGNASVIIDRKNQIAVICLLNKTSWDGLADQYAGKIKEVFIRSTDNDFKTWQRIYGTPYSSKYELVGKWKGIIKQPVTDISIPVEMLFDNSNEIILKIDNKICQINNPTYNLLQELEGAFNAVLPNIYGFETRCGFKLKHQDNMLNGYIQYDHNTENRFYRLPLYIELKKDNY